MMVMMMMMMTQLVTMMMVMRQQLRQPPPPQPPRLQLLVPWAVGLAVVQVLQPLWHRRRLPRGQSA